jgi:hypothetical protein
MATNTKRIEQLEKHGGDQDTQISLTLDLAARILEGKWDAATSGADSAEALLKAISPKYASLTVRPFPAGR